MKVLNDKEHIKEYQKAIWPTPTRVAITTMLKINKIEITSDMLHDVKNSIQIAKLNIDNQQNI